MRSYGTGLVAHPGPAAAAGQRAVPVARAAARRRAAVIGTVVAEVSIGLRGGIGRLIIEYAQSAGGDPAKSWAPIFGAVLIGLVAAGFVTLIGLALRLPPGGGGGMMRP